MAVQRWSDDTLVVRLGDDPELSEDVTEIQATLQGACCDAVLDLSDVDRVTAEGVVGLLKVRKSLHAAGRRLILCSVRNGVWGVFLSAGLDRHFEFAPSISEALARLEGGKR
jgi:anti-anti-sigma regulatory factor